MEDNRIVELYLNRDEMAIKQTAEKFGKRLFQLAYGIVCDKQTAEECVNDTYMKAWLSIPPQQPRDYFYAFLKTITRRVALNCCRNRNRLKRSAFICELSAEMEQCIPTIDNVECSIDDMELRRILNDFLGQLTDENRNIFVRRYWYMDSIIDISKHFALSESKVKTTLYRCRNQLKEYIEKECYIL